MTILIDPTSKPIGRPHETACGAVILDQGADTGLAIAVADPKNQAVRYALRGVNDKVCLAQMLGPPLQQILLAAGAPSLRLSFDRRTENAPNSRKNSVGLLALGFGGFFVVAENTESIEPTPVAIALSDWQTVEDFTRSGDYEWYSEWSLVSVDALGERTVVIERKGA